jgi:CRISPR/Cas system-associated endoribonuclease Cas2
MNTPEMISYGPMRKFIDEQDSIRIYDLDHNYAEVGEH